MEPSVYLRVVRLRRWSGPAAGSWCKHECGGRCKTRCKAGYCLRHRHRFRPPYYAILASSTSLFLLSYSIASTPTLILTTSYAHKRSHPSLYEHAYCPIPIPIPIPIAGEHSAPGSRLSPKRQTAQEAGTGSFRARSLA